MWQPIPFIGVTYTFSLQSGSVEIYPVHSSWETRKGSQCGLTMPESPTGKDSFLYTTRISNLLSTSLGHNIIQMEQCGWLTANNLLDESGRQVAGQDQD